MSAHPNFLVSNPVGRLITTRLFALPSRAAAVEFAERFTEVTARVPGVVMICADYRPITIFSPEVADVLLSLMAAHNSRVERSAILAMPEHATHSLQTARLAKSSGHQMRRRFTSDVEMLSWLGEALTPAELQRARAFLDELRPAAP